MTDHHAVGVNVSLFGNEKDGFRIRLVFDDGDTRETPDPVSYDRDEAVRAMNDFIDSVRELNCSVTLSRPQ